MAIRTETLRLSRQLRATVGGEADTATRQLTAAWVNAWDHLAADMEAAITEVLALAGRLGRWPSPAQLNRVNRLYRALITAQQSLGMLAQRAGVTIVDAAGRAITVTAAGEPGLIASQLPAAERAAAERLYASRIRPTALQVIVARTGTQITAATQQLAAPAVESMHRALVRGVALGENPRKAGQAMFTAVEGAFNGGLDRAVNIARTEILDAYRTTSQYAHAANADVLDGWIWLCTLSPRTCPACLAMNGSTHPLSEPGPLDHQSGRCARMPKVKSWSALGLSGREPADTVPDARKWFADQPPAVQRQIMGPGRLGALNSGKTNWEDLARRRETPAWRASYVPTRVRDLDGVPAAAATRPTPAAAPPAPAGPAAPLPRRTPPPATPPPPAPLPTADAPRPLLGELIVDAWQGITAREPFIVDAAKWVFEGDFGGLTTEVKVVTPTPHSLAVYGDIYDPDHNQVGEFARDYRRDPNDGTLTAHHAYLKLERDVQGQGFAEEFNNHVEAWYRESGVDAIELLANIDVGGYAWARSGYDFATVNDAIAIIGKLEDKLGIYEGQAELLRLDIDAGDGDIAELTAELNRIEEQVLAGEAIVEAAQTHAFGELGYPTAYEISQAGRWAGATREDEWIGKSAMLGSSWNGVKPL
jgi:hypothetical protein